MTTPPPSADPDQGPRDPRLGESAPPPPGHGQAAGTKRNADFVFTVALLIVAAGVAGFGSAVQYVVLNISVGCGVSGPGVDTCIATQRTLTVTALFLPWVILGVTASVAIRLLMTRRPAFWVPLVGIGLLVGAIAAIAAVYAAALQGAQA